MHPKAALLLAFGPDSTQSLGLRVTGIVQKTGVLDGEHPLVLRHPLDRPLVMRCSYALRCHLIVVEKSIGGLGIGPILTGSVDRPVWLHPKLHSQLATAAIQTGVLQLDSGKLIEAPLILR